MDCFLQLLPRNFPIAIVTTASPKKKWIYLNKNVLSSNDYREIE